MNQAYEAARWANTRRRLARGAAADVVGKLYIAAIQLISVPVLVSVWGLDKYGVWLMLTTIPTYLALSDFGFSQAATAEMAMRIARDERDQALVTFQSLWCLVLLVGGALVALSALILFGSVQLLQSVPWASDHVAIICVLTCYAVVGQWSRVALAGFQASGHYAFGNFTYSTLSFVEGLFVLAAAALGGSQFECALVLLLLRCAIGLYFFCLLRRRVAWLQVGSTNASNAELRRLFRPALGAMSIPLSLALNIQGMVLIVGTVLTPSEAATFGAVRTLSRVAVQIVGVVGRASMPEVSSAMARGEKEGLSRILYLNCAVVAAVLLPSLAILLFFGPQIVEMWTGGSIKPDHSFVAIMAVGMGAHAIWMLSTQVLLAVNGQGRVAVLALGVSVITFASAFPAAHVLGLEGVAMVLLTGDLVLSIYGAMAVKAGIPQRSLP